MPANGPMQQLAAVDLSRCFIKARENLTGAPRALHQMSDPLPAQLPNWAVELAAECSRLAILEFCRINHLPHTFPGP